MFDRRRFALGSLAACVGGAVIPRRAAASNNLASLSRRLARLEADSGGRLGVAVLDAQGSVAGHREGERFPMCSTFKALAAAAILARVDAGQEQLSRRIEIAPADVLAYAPVTKQHVGAEGLSVAGLCEAMVTLSDNGSQFAAQEHGRAGRRHPLCALARRYRDAARPLRARAQHVHPRR